MTNPNDPAFALEGSRPGLTKREWYAGLAMQGLCANGSLMQQVSIACNANPEIGCETIAAMAKMQADALIAELSK